MWSEHFPSSEKQQPPSSLPPPSPPRDGYQRCLICPFCNGACRLLTSNSVKNPNRKYYKCCGHDHDFFKWADNVKPTEFIDVPYCGGCNAGVCRVQKVKAGPNAGRVLFLCTIKEGEGSCGHRIWKDELEKQAREAAEFLTSSPQNAINCGNNSSTNVDLVEKRTQKCELAGKESPVIDTSQHLQCTGAASGKMEKFKLQEERSQESSRRPPKRSRHGDLKAPGSLISARTLTMYSTKNSVCGEHGWMAAAIRQNLSTELQGWWGRLVFHPMPSLIIHAFCYICSTTMHCGCLMPDKSLVNSDSLTTVTRSFLEGQRSSEPLVHYADLMSGIRPFQVAQDVPSSGNHMSATRFHNVMSDSISKAFAQAAVDVQNKFLTLLETMDAQDHEAMSHEAETTFAALDCLMFDHQDLKEYTNTLIDCARKLSESTQAMAVNDSYQKLLDQCSSERMKLDEITHIHAEVFQSMTRNKNHLEVLQERISSIKSWLLQAEAKLCLYKVEMKNMELVADKICESKENLEEKYVVAVKELEELQRLSEHKKTEHEAAKAAFDQARALLRGYICAK